MKADCAFMARTLLRREFQLAWRHGSQSLTVILFFILVVTLVPLGVGPDPALLRRLGPGVLWVAALLATLLALGRLWAEDFASGALEAFALSDTPLPLLVAVKIFAHWLLTGLPIVLIAPWLAVQFALPADVLPTLLIALLLGTPVLSLVGAIGAALTLGLRSATTLLSLLVLPLYTPVLIFGSGAVEAQAAGGDPAAHLWLLAALLAFTMFFAPLVTAFALRIALES